MKWSYQVARIAGIDVKIHATFFLLLAWFAFVYYTQGGLAEAVVGLAFIILLFLCVLLHEFGHALAARSYGIRTPDITLLPIGGVARLERMPDHPWQELVVALAGPAVNVVIAFALWVVVGRMVGWGDLEGVDTVQGNILMKLLAVNVMLVIFNLLPAFPMDGGRVLRALLATRLPHHTATGIAATVGQVVAVLLGLAGLFGNPLLLFIAVFVFFGARGEAAVSRLKHAVEDTRVTEVMDPSTVNFSPDTTLVEAVRRAMPAAQRDFPLLDGSLRLLGLVSAESLAAAVGSRPAESSVAGLLRRDYEVITAEASLLEAWHIVRSSSGRSFPVVTAGGQYLGLVTRESLERVLAERGAPWMGREE